jgi:hypothetical protein
LLEANRVTDCEAWAVKTGTFIYYWVLAYKVYKINVLALSDGKRWSLMGAKQSLNVTKSGDRFVKLKSFVIPMNR